MVAKHDDPFDEQGAAVRPRDDYDYRRAMEERPLDDDDRWERNAEPDRHVYASLSRCPCGRHEDQQSKHQYEAFHGVHLRPGTPESGVPALQHRVTLCPMDG